MITTILIYELKVAILLAAFYMFYRILLSKETFHKLNRIILLFTAIASFVLPLCVITITKTVRIKFEAEPLLMVTGNDEAPVVQTYDQLWQTILLGIMIAGALFLITKTIVSIVEINKIIRDGEHKFLPDGTEIVISEKAKNCPFSWLHYVVMTKEEYYESSRSIILHEQGHINFGHSWDIIITDILTSLQWFNPAIWMLRADLRAIHEFQADDYALRNGINIKEYQLLLIKKAISMSGYSVANGFNHSILKNRITMMLSKKSSVRSLMKTLYLIPAVGISLTAFAETKTITLTETEQSLRSETEFESSNFSTHLQEYASDSLKTNDKVQREVQFTVNGVPATKEYVDLITKDEQISSVNINTYDNFDCVELTTEKMQLSEEIFMVVDEMPEFPGGEDALRKFLAESIKYPEKLTEDVRVFVQFVVNKEGDVVNVRLARPMNIYADAEAIRVVKSMPKWKPGKHRGECVSVSYTVPFSFKK
ncbi:MAG: energy transducer TonB [Marinilabiliaceae bacterium]|nr:energy transducer TonB [Marinilabiliaceae bacterium]